MRQRILEWAAEALGAAAPVDVPSSLTRVARFAPTKRARLAGRRLAQAVQNDVAFRALVAERATRKAERSCGDRRRRVPDLVTAAARAYLLRLPDGGRVAGGRGGGDASRSTPGPGWPRSNARSARLTAKLERVQAELRAATAEVDNRNPVRTPIGCGCDCGNRAPEIRELQQLVDGKDAKAAELLAGVVVERDRARADAESWRQRAEASGAQSGRGSHRTCNGCGNRRGIGAPRPTVDWSCCWGRWKGPRPDCVANGI